jgi:hypothetical protein
VSEDSALPSWARRPRRSQGAAFLQNGVEIPLDANYAAARGVQYPFPLENPAGPHYDIDKQQPPELRNARATRTFSRYIDQASGAFDWVAAFDAFATELFRHIDHRVFFATQTFSIGAAPVVARPEEDRRYLFINNTHNAQNVFVGFGYAPSAVTGLRLLAGGFFEPLWVPQNEIQLLGSGAATTGIIVYAN